MTIKRLGIVWMILCLTILPVSAVPYTEVELEEYMEAIYCEQPWATEYPSFWVQFIDVDLDGRKELISIEAGESDAPKNAHAYAFMDAELSHRGYLTVGELDVCRDTKTNESFMVNRLNGVTQRLVYDRDDMVIETRDLSDAQVARLESYGYSPIIVTQEQRDSIKVYEDCRALFLPAYQHDDTTNGEPPLMTYSNEEPRDRSALLWGSLAVAAAIGAATAVWLMSRRVKARQ